MNRNSGDWGCYCIFWDHFFTIWLIVPKSALFLKYDKKWGNFSHCAYAKCSWLDPQRVFKILSALKFRVRNFTSEEQNQHFCRDFTLFTINIIVLWLFFKESIWKKQGGDREGIVNMFGLVPFALVTVDLFADIGAPNLSYNATYH